MRRLALGLALTLVAAAPPTHAEDAHDAAWLFQEGRRLFEENNLSEACEHFRKSNELEPRVGTALNLARCEEKRGHLAAALAAWNASAELAREFSDERLDMAKEHVSSLERRVPRLTIVAPPDAPTGSKLRVMSPNTPPREEPLDVGSLRVDVGTTTVVVEAPGHRSLLREVTLAEGQDETLSLPLGEPLGGPLSNGPSDAGAGDDMRLAGWIVGGVGVGVLAVGGILGFLAKSKLDDSNEAGCEVDGTDCTDRRGVDLRDEAISFASGSTALFVIGGLATATGVTLILVAPDGEPDEVALELTLGPSRLGLSGRF